MSAPNVSGTVERAISLHERGALEKADKLYAKVLKKQPAHAQVLHMRGALKLQQGHHVFAEQLLQKAIHGDEADPWVHFHLAQTYAATDRHELACKHYQRAMQGGVNDADLHFMYGNSRFELRRLPEAIDSYQRALALAPDDSDCRLNLANALEAQGDMLAAAECIEPLVKRSDKPLSLRLQIAELLTGANRHLAAHDVLLQLGTITVTDAPALLSTAKIMHRHGRRESTVFLIEHVREYADSLDSAQYDVLVGLLNDLGRFDESRILLQARPENESSAWAWFQRGICAQVAGDFQKAVACHRTALERDDDLGVAAYSLASNGMFECDDEVLSRWRSKAENVAVESQQRAQFAFAAGRILDKREQYDEAFEQFLNANALVAGRHPFDADAWDAYVDKVINTFTLEFFKTKRALLALDQLPSEFSGQHLVFVVGMPRSGSTLLEHRLVEHLGLTGLGEHHALHRIAADLPELTGHLQEAPSCAKDLDASQVEELRRYYLDSLPASLAIDGHRQPCGDSVLFVDKMLGNFIRLGVLAMMFPQARVLHCRRDPMATAVSCFTNAFSSGLRFTYDLNGLGRAWQSYQRLMRHWNEVLPLRLMDVDYEVMVNKPEQCLNQIDEFLGRSNSHQQKEADLSSSGVRDVSTASFWQVRQPINTRSVKAWKRFESHLGPLHDGLEHKR